MLLKPRVVALLHRGTGRRRHHGAILIGMQVHGVAGGRMKVSLLQLGARVNKRTRRVTESAAVADTIADAVAEM